jgi:hypothetical protein
MQQFRGFVMAVERLAAVAAKSREFKSREKDAAALLYSNVSFAASVDECKQAFNAAYRVLGAPGDFGYGTPEGDAMKGVYDSWNKALQEHREACSAAAIDRVAMGM